MITRVKQTLSEVGMRRRHMGQYRQLSHLDDKILRDIGLTRAEARAAGRSERSFFYL